MMYEELRQIGSQCKSIRQMLGVTQVDVGKELGYSDKTIAMFEKGHNNNLYIFTWYLRHGFNIHSIRGYNNGKEA